MSFRKAVLVVGAVALGAVLASPQAATAGTILQFDCISTSTNCVFGETNFTVDVSDAGSNKVSFKFMNSGAALAISDVYFDDGTLLGIATVTDGPGVNFEQGASPGELEDGDTLSPAFVTTAGFSADAEGPVSTNGVHAGEFVTIIFNLQAGKTYANTITALEGGVDLRIGIRAQAAGVTGAPASFVNIRPEGEDDVTPIAAPEPTSLMLLATGLGGVWRMRRKRQSQAL